MECESTDDVSIMGGSNEQDHGDAMAMGVGRLNAMVGAVWWPLDGKPDSNRIPPKMIQNQ